jgi:hypothetical protein
MGIITAILLCTIVAILIQKNRRTTQFLGS